MVFRFLRGEGGYGDVPLWVGMGWFGEESGEEFSSGFHLRGEESFFAHCVLDVPTLLDFFGTFADGEAIVELVASELIVLAIKVVLDEADEVAGREARIVEDFDGALGSEVAGVVLEAGGFLRIGRRVGRGWVLVAAPLQDVGAVEAPDGHAGGAYSVFLAEVGAVLPAVAGAGWRVIEEEEEFVEEGDGTAVGVFGVLESMLEGGDARNGRRSYGRRLSFVGDGCICIWEIHKAVILRQAG